MKKIALAIVFIFLLFFMTGCSASIEIYDTKLEGINVIWTPVVFIVQWFIHSFSPSFWGWIHQIWGALPWYIVWIAAIVTYALALALYCAIAIIAIVITVVFAIICGIVWFIIAIFVGLFTSIFQNVFVLIKI